MSREPETVFTVQEMETLIGQKVIATWEMIAWNGRMFHKVDGEWIEYPDPVDWLPPE